MCIPQGQHCPNTQTRQRQEFQGRWEFRLGVACQLSASGGELSREVQTGRQLDPGQDSGGMWWSWQQHTASLMYTDMSLMDRWDLAPVSVDCLHAVSTRVPSPSSPLVSLTGSKTSSFHIAPMPTYSSVYKLGLRPLTSYLAVTIAVYINVLTRTQVAAAIEWDFSFQFFLIFKQRTSFCIGTERKAFSFLWWIQNDYPVNAWCSS